MLYQNSEGAISHNGWDKLPLTKTLPSYTLAEPRATTPSAGCRLARLAMKQKPPDAEHRTAR